VFKSFLQDCSSSAITRIQKLLFSSEEGSTLDLQPLGTRKPMKLKNNYFTQFACSSLSTQIYLQTDQKRRFFILPNLLVSVFIDTDISSDRSKALF